MFGNNAETICAMLCLLSKLEHSESLPPPFKREKVRAMLENGDLDALVLREGGYLGKQTINRAKKLLARSSAVFNRMDVYAQDGYTVLLPGNEAWPARLEKLGKDMPLYLFAKGNVDLCRGRTVAVAGSRTIDRKTVKKARRIGKILAEKGMTVVSGGAHGVDSEVQNAALAAGGSVIIVAAVTIDTLLRNPLNRKALDEGKLLLLSETPPDEPFSADKALTRNHAIYAMGDCAMVLAARKRIGGSWSGAYACLKGKWSPVFTLDEQGDGFEGNEALIELGALRMHLSETVDELLLEGMSREMMINYGLMKHTAFETAEDDHAHTGRY